MKRKQRKSESPSCEPEENGGHVSEDEETEAVFDEDFADTEEQNGKHEINEEDKSSVSQLYAVLGRDEFKDPEAIKVTSSWVSQATTFSAVIDKETSKKLSSVSLPEFLSNRFPDGIASWFPVQHSVLPSLLADIRNPPAFRPRDVAIAAPTGSGKTLCYVLPVLSAVGNVDSDILYAVIVVPVQTLVKQIDQEFRKWNIGGRAKIVSLSGANDFDKEARMLTTTRPNIVVATQSRLVQHLTATIPSALDLSRLRFLVVDEADRMGMLMREEWLDVVEQRCGGMDRAAGNVADAVRLRRAPQKIVLSATLSKDVEELHLWNLFHPRLFCATSKSSKEISKEISHMSGTLALPAAISHKLLVVATKFHPLILYHSIVEAKWNRVLVFVNEVDSTDRLAHVMKTMCAGNYSVEFFTASLFGKRRFEVLKRFKNGEKRILVCSDVLARGVDVEDIDCVVNYNLPQSDKLFVHRSGRTGRAGRSGSVLSIADNESKRIFKKMLIKTGLWEGCEENEVDESVFEPYIEKYKGALESLQNVVKNGEKSKNGKAAASRSGFEGKRKRRKREEKPEEWWKKKKKNVKN